MAAHLNLSNRSLVSNSISNGLDTSYNTRHNVQTQAQQAYCRTCTSSETLVLPSSTSYRQKSHSRRGAAALASQVRKQQASSVSRPGPTRRKSICHAYSDNGESKNGVEVPTSAENGFPNAPETSPAPGFAKIEDAIEEIRKGRFVLVVDDEDRENEGDLIIAAESMTPEKMAFMVNHTSGVICAGLTPTRAKELNLPLMVPPDLNEDRMTTAYTITCDAKDGISTGISAADRTLTVKLLADAQTEPSDFRRPGHVFPLIAREAGVLERTGHTEAAVDLSRLAGMSPCGVLSEVVNRDGSMQRTPELKEFAKEHGLLLISIADLVAYRKKHSNLIKRTAKAHLPTEFGDFSMICYESLLDGEEHVALVKGEIGDGEGVLSRLHSECLTGDIFHSQRCDCGPQLQLAMKKLEREGRGVIVYLRGHEGRGIGLSAKLKAYELQEQGRDTVEANTDQGLPIDSREYCIGAQMLLDLGVKSVNLMTNNPDKEQAVKQYGIAVNKRIPLVTPINPNNRKYIETKRSKMGHIYSLDGSWSDSHPPTSPPPPMATGAATNGHSPNGHTSTNGSSL